MDKVAQIRNVTMTIQELCNLIRALSEPGYTTEQARAYYKKIFEMYMIETDEEEATGA
jgi:hypothetical protein